MRKFSVSAAAVLLGVICLVGCQSKPAETVPAGTTAAAAAAQAEAGIDFDQLSEDVFSAFESSKIGAYAFVDDLVITGDNETKVVKVTASVMNGTEEVQAAYLLAACFRHINDAAAIQDSRYKDSTPESFGNFYDDYAVEAKVNYTESGDELCHLYSTAGGGIQLSPDYEVFEEVWEKAYELAKEEET